MNETKQNNLANNINAVKLVIILALTCIVWSNTENLTLNAGGFMHQLNIYLMNPMLYVLLMGFGYLTLSSKLIWKDYGKILLACAILSLISSVMYIDYFAFKEGYVSTGYIIGNYFKVLLFDYGKWVIWTIIGLSALFKLIHDKFNDETEAWKIVQIITIISTLTLFLIISIVGLYYFIDTHINFYTNFDKSLIYVALTEGSFFQLIPAVTCFLIGILLKWFVELTNKNKNLITLISIAMFFMITCLRIIFRFPTIYWDFMVILQAITLLLPFLFLTIPNFKIINYLFYASVMILMFHIAFNKLLSVDFGIGLLIRAIFGLTAARNVEVFFNNNLFIALIYSMLKVLILLALLSWIAKYYLKPFKFKFLQTPNSSDPSNIKTKKIAQRRFKRKSKAKKIDLTNSQID